MSGTKTAFAESALAQARALTHQGRHDQAAALWAEIARVAPDHAEANFNLARAMMARGLVAEAIPLFEKAEAAEPNEPLIPLELALALRRSGDAARERAALDRALTADPYCYPAMLFKGDLLERGGAKRDAAMIYQNALRIAPRAEAAPAGLAPLLARARIVAEEHRRALQTFFVERLAEERARHSGAPLDRIDEMIDAATGAKKIYHHEPTLLHFPRLPAIQFFDDALFPWMRELEAATDDIAEELARVVAEDAGGFIPYVRFQPGQPVNQWAELNHSPKWSAYFFHENGERNDEHCRRCPKTAAALERLPLAGTPGYTPNAFFSTLAPGAHIPPHTGSTNARLIGHLPIIVPGECLFRVGNETRPWKRGKAWIFDDSIEHEAWNRTEKLRVILIFDVWNPLVTAAERDMINAFLAARREFYARP